MEIEAIMLLIERVGTFAAVVILLLLAVGIPVGLYIRSTAKGKDARTYAEKIEADTRQSMNDIAQKALSTLEQAQHSQAELYERLNENANRVGELMAKVEIYAINYEELRKRLEHAERQREQDRVAFLHRQEEQDKRYHALQEENKGLLRQIADLRVEQTKLTNLMETEHSTRESLRVELQKQVESNTNLIKENSELKSVVDLLRGRVETLENAGPHTIEQKPEEKIQ